jgi:hypothetical protein
MIQEELNVVGTVEIELLAANGTLKHKEIVSNLVMTAGKNLFVRKIINDTENISTIAIGSGDTPATVSDTQLESELASEDVRFQFIDTQNQNVLINLSTFAEGVGTGTIREVGLLSDSTPKKLLCRTVVSTPFEKAATDYLNVSWKIKIG